MAANQIDKKAEALKNLGNKLFSEGDLKSAIDKYSQAIQLKPKNHIYLSNRKSTIHKPRFCCRTMGRLN